MKIEISVGYYNIPLTRSYKLSYGDVDLYDTWIVCIKSAGRYGLGEVTALPGYSWESVRSIDGSMRKFLEDASYMKSTDQVKRYALENVEKTPFAFSAILMALETFDLAPNIWKFGGKSKTPLVALLEGDVDELAESFQLAWSTGYRSFKLKVGRDVEKDVHKIMVLARLMTGRPALHLDANQGYSFDEALYLCQSIEGTPVRLLEQPFKFNQWDEQTELSNKTAIPLMLDESIWTQKDIVKTVERKCAQYLKLKTLKHGGIKGTIRLIKQARENGFKVILGNGVQTEIGCFIENYVYRDQNLDMPGEMNGFLKMKRPMVRHSLEVKYGGLLASGIFYDMEGECESLPRAPHWNQTITLC